METKIIKSDSYEFIVSFEARDSSSLYRKVATVTQIQRLSIDYWEYQSKRSSDTTTDKEEARVWFVLEETYRGDWDIEMNFKENIFSGSEINVLSNVYSIVEWMLKSWIINENPTEYLD